MLTKTIISVLMFGSLCAFSQTTKRFFVLDCVNKVEKGSVVYKSFDSEKAHAKGKSSCESGYKETKEEAKSKKRESCFSYSSALMANYADKTVEGFAKDFADAIEDKLIEKGVIDTTATLLKGNKYFFIRPVLKSFCNNYISDGKNMMNNYSVFDAEIDFEILNVYKEPLISFNCKHTTGYLDKDSKLKTMNVFNMENYMDKANKRAEAQVNQFKSMMDSLATYLVNSPVYADVNKGTYDSKAEKYEPMALKNKISEVAKLNEYTKSVVTVVTNEGHGSGSIISSDGYILTNYHVIAGVKEISVMNDAITKTKATLVRYDKNYDLAVLKIEMNDLPTLAFNSEEAELGMNVIAIGTPADIELGQTITKGSVSGFRKIDDAKFIQTDAKVSPGNSGGPLVNDKGEIIGVVSSKIVGKGIEGIAFALPTKYVLEQLKLNFTR